MNGIHHLKSSPATPAWAEHCKSRLPPGIPWADAAADVLRDRLEALASQLAELEALRQQVLEAEQKLDARYPDEKSRAAVSAA